MIVKSIEESEKVFQELDALLDIHVSCPEENKAENHQVSASDEVADT